MSHPTPPPSPASRLMRGYGPLFAFAILFLLMAALVPTVGQEIKTVAVAGPGGGAGARCDRRRRQPRGRRRLRPRRHRPTAPAVRPPGRARRPPAAGTAPPPDGAGKAGGSGATGAAAGPGGTVGRPIRRPAPHRRLRHPQGAGPQRPVLPALHRLLG